MRGSPELGVTLFHHPEAGETEWSAQALLGALEAAGVDAAYCSLEGEGWQDCLARTYELAIAAGGDGTVARMAAAMPDRRVPLALVPLGSANNIAASLGYPDIGTARLLSGLSNPSETELRIGSARGRWGLRSFVESVGLGALARSTAELQEDRLEGSHKREAGRAELARIVSEVEPVRLSLQADGEPLCESALLVECMNTAMIGPNLRLGEAAERGDRNLCVVWLPASRREDMLDWLGDPEGKGLPPVSRVPARRVAFHAHDEPLRIDDKTVEWDGSHMSLELDDAAVRILVPGRDA